jgi:hypothetical protein
MEVSDQLHAPAALPRGKSPWYSLARRLGGPQTRSGDGGEEKNSLPLPGLEPPIIQPVAQQPVTEIDCSALNRVCILTDGQSQCA